MLPLEFIREYKDRVNWAKICRNTINQMKVFPTQFVREFKSEIIWELLARVPHDEKFWSEFGDQYTPDEWANIISDPKFFSDELLLKFVNVRYTWKVICAFRKMSSKFMEEHIDMLDWRSISLHQNLEAKFIEKHKEKLDIHSLLFWRKNNLNQTLLRELIPINSDAKDLWEDACKQTGVWDMNFIRENLNKIDWDRILTWNRNFPPEFFYEFGNKLHTDLLEGTQNMPEDFIERYKERWNWDNIIIIQKLSEKFMRRNINILRKVKKIEFLFSKQQMSEKFIEYMLKQLGKKKAQNHRVWFAISAHQKLSESFIEKHAEDVDWFNILTKQDVSPEFRMKWCDKLNVSEAIRYKHWLEDKLKEDKNDL